MSITKFEFFTGELQRPAEPLQSKTIARKLKSYDPLNSKQSLFRTNTISTNSGGKYSNSAVVSHSNTNYFSSFNTKASMCETTQTKPNTLTPKLSILYLIFVILLSFCHKLLETTFLVRLLLGEKHSFPYSRSF